VDTFDPSIGWHLALWIFLILCGVCVLLLSIYALVRYPRLPEWRTSNWYEKLKAIGALTIGVLVSAFLLVALILIMVHSMART
jgi:MFS family permease